MPRRFFTLRNRFMQEGMSKKAAEGKAARIVNAHLKPGEKAVGSAHKHKA